MNFTSSRTASPSTTISIPITQSSSATTHYLSIYSSDNSPPLFIASSPFFDFEISPPLCRHSTTSLLPLPTLLFTDYRTASFFAKTTHLASNRLLFSLTTVDSHTLSNLGAAGCPFNACQATLPHPPSYFYFTTCHPSLYHRFPNIRLSITILVKEP
jgi:hypothetical protein